MQNCIAQAGWQTKPRARDRAHLAEVQAAFEEGAQRELAGACPACASLQAGLQGARGADGPAVRVQLDDVLARVRARRQHCQQQHLSRHMFQCITYE